MDWEKTSPIDEKDGELQLGLVKVPSSIFKEKKTNNDSDGDPNDAKKHLQPMEAKYWAHVI